MATFCGLWQPLATEGNFWQSIASYGNFLELMAIFVKWGGISLSDSYDLIWPKLHCLAPFFPVKSVCCVAPYFFPRFFKMHTRFKVWVVTARLQSLKYSITKTRILFWNISNLFLTENVEFVTQISLVFSIFTIVRFQNEPCLTSAMNNGTCYTKNDCANRGGLAQGSCASGFGVCCYCKLSLEIKK